MKVTLVFADDWQGLYFGNNLVKEDHILYAHHVLELLVGNCAVLDYQEEHVIDSALWLDRLGSFPETLEEFYKLEEKND